MRFGIFVCSIFGLSSGCIMAGELNKPYFGATAPGSWVKYESSYEMKGGLVGKHLLTFTRLPDKDGRTRIELVLDVMSGPGEGTSMKQIYGLKPGFNLAQDRLNFGKWIETMETQTGDTPPMVQSDDIIKLIRDSMPDYSGGMTLIGPDSVEGRKCDLFSYSVDLAGPNPTQIQGKMWLDASLPFGVVLDTGETKNTSTGEWVTRSEMRLLDMGIRKIAVDASLGGISEPKFPPQADDKRVETFSLLDAFIKEKIKMDVSVVEGSNGARLQIEISNKTYRPMKIKIPKGRTDLVVGSPIGTLSIQVKNEQVVELAIGETAPSVEVDQTGKRGAVEGHFSISVYEGEPLFSGSATVGSLP